MLPFSSLKKKHAFAGLLIAALAGGCGEDAPAASTDEDEDNAQDEEGTKKDAGKDAGKDASTKKDARADDPKQDESCSSPGTRACDDCDEERCVQVCASGKWGACRPVGDVVGSVLDGGLAGILGDAASVRVTDGGVEVSFGEASVALPTAECPSSTICASRGMGVAGMFLSGALMGASFCAMDDMFGLPPTCMTVADCQMLGFGSAAMCYPLAGFGSYCIQFCK